MRILCNLPLDGFDARSAMRGIELVTFGMPERCFVEGESFPFDVEFDSSTGSYRELAARLPAGFEPDLVLHYWPDQDPLPAGLEQCPVPVVGVVSDYNLTLPYLVGLWPFFDVLLCDRSGQDLFRRLSFADVRYWCQFAHKQPLHRVWEDAGPRDIDIGFAGNLNPEVQRERAPWLQRVMALQQSGVRAEVVGGVRGIDYGRRLNRYRIGWNRSIRREMNLRAFEVPACGALLMMERENREVADFFIPGEECVLYGDDDFEQITLELLGDPDRLSRIARAGHRRVQDHRFGNRIGELTELLADVRPNRPNSTEADRILGRAIAMLGTWADGATIAAAALAAHDLAPDDPRTLNLLGLATLRWRGAEGGNAAWRLWQQALAVAPNYLPAAANLAVIARAANDPSLERTAREELTRRSETASWTDLDGPTLPFGFSSEAVDRSLALQTAVLHDEPTAFARVLSS